MSVKLYRVKHKTNASGYAYTIGWTDADGNPKRRQFADETKAEQEGRTIAANLAAGQVEAAAMTREDRNELLAIREAARGRPPLSVIREWRTAFEMSGGNILPACEAWVARKRPTFTPVLVETAVNDFITAKERSGKQGEATYRAKLKPLAVRFKSRHLHALTQAELTAYLETFADGVTRNDIRKRTSSLFRWAQRAGHLPRYAPLAILETERAHEEQRPIGIITAETYRAVLVFFREHHPKLLGAVVLAGFCGIRSDEIHGKRKDRTKRQLWIDVHIDRKFVQVTVAKQNTPAWRIVPLCDAAVAWLKMCDRTDETVCGPGDMEEVRRLAIAVGFGLPDNCFRHSFISHRIAEIGDKAKVATEAGNSVKEIDRRYRVPLPEAEGKAWAAILPTDDAPATPQAAPVRT